jgi:hypothetical protein
MLCTYRVFTTAFLTAAGYASAAVLYNLADPPFVNGPYTVAQFEVSLKYPCCWNSSDFCVGLATEKFGVKWYSLRKYYRDQERDWMSAC